MCRASVVIPVYNVLPYLNQCLASACEQTMADLELICVDDGSTDGSGQLLDAWAAREPRIRVVHKANGGLSSARNAGVDVARGTYVFHLDGDDCLEPDALERICAAFDATDADVVTFGATCFPDRPTPWLERCLSPRHAIFEGFSPDILLNEASNPFAWRTACRRDWLLSSGVRFDESVRYGEDTIWHFSLYPAARRTVLVPDRAYRYRLNRSGSLMDTQAKGSAERTLSHVAVVERVFATWDQAGILDRWAAQLADWSVSYVLYAALRQPVETRSQAVCRLRDLYVRYQSALDQASLAPHVRAMIGLALSLRDDGSCPRGSLWERAVCLHWRLRQYGIVDLVQTVTGKGGGRSGSGE